MKWRFYLSFPRLFFRMLYHSLVTVTGFCCTNRTVCFFYDGLGAWAAPMLGVGSEPLPFCFFLNDGVTNCIIISTFIVSWIRSQSREHVVVSKDKHLLCTATFKK